MPKGRFGRYGKGRCITGKDVTFTMLIAKLKHVDRSMKNLMLQKKSCTHYGCCSLYVLDHNSLYDTSIALVTFCFGSVFGIVMVRTPSSTLAEI